MKKDPRINFMSRFFLCARPKRMKHIFSSFVATLSIILCISSNLQNIEANFSEYSPALRWENMQNSFCLSWNLDRNNRQSQCPTLSTYVVNIGSGTADNIIAKFDPSILHEWVNTLKKINPYGNYDYLYSNQDEMTQKITYLKGNAEEATIINIPSCYINCLLEFYKIKEKPIIRLPGIKLRLSCKDLQANSNKHIFETTFLFDEICYSISNDGTSNIKLNLIARDITSAKTNIIFHLFTNFIWENLIATVFFIILVFVFLIIFFILFENRSNLSRWLRFFIDPNNGNTPKYKPPDKRT